MGKKAFNLFFAVGDPSRRSTLWRTWGTLRGDVFVTSCEADSDFKVSLHPADDRHARSRCHVAYASKESLNNARAGTHNSVVEDPLPEGFASARSDGYGRFDDVWEPAEIVPGLFMAFRIWMPDSELRPLRRGVLANRPVRWLPAPGRGRNVEASFTIGSRRVSEDEVPGAASVGNQLLLRHEFNERRTLLVVWRAHELTPEEQMWVTAYRPSVLGVSERLRGSEEEYDYHRTVIEVRDGSNSRAWIDTAIE